MFLRVSLSFLFIFFQLSEARGFFTQAISKQELLKHGRAVYLKRCVGCHGKLGDGQGDAAPFLFPKPRDFTSGVFKFKSTPNESLPTDQDLMRVLSLGVWGTSMPSFVLMPEKSKFAVIEYIKTFSDQWQEESNKLAPIGSPQFPKEDFLNYQAFISRAKRGRELFKENCVICHGRLGDGHGVGGEDLEDDWGQKILPADLRRDHIKSGASVRDIYRVIQTGVAGTPMVSYFDVLENKDILDLTAYVFYLRGLNNGIYDPSRPPLKEITQKEAEDM